MTGSQQTQAIEIRVDEVSQLFNTLDPFPFHERDLDSDAEEYIVGWARELANGRPFTIVVHLPPREADTDAARGLRSALARFFAYRADVLGRDFNELFRVGRTALLIGLAVLGSVSPPASLSRTGPAKAISAASSERAWSSSAGSRTGARSRYFCMTGGPYGVAATCTGALPRPM